MLDFDMHYFPSYHVIGQIFKFLSFSRPFPPVPPIPTCPCSTKHQHVPACVLEPCLVFCMLSARGMQEKVVGQENTLTWACQLGTESWVGCLLPKLQVGRLR